MLHNTNSMVVKLHFCYDPLPLVFKVIKSLLSFVQQNSKLGVYLYKNQCSRKIPFQRIFWRYYSRSKLFRCWISSSLIFSYTRIYLSKKNIYIKENKNPNFLSYKDGVFMGLFILINKKKEMISILLTNEKVNPGNHYPHSRLKT